VEVTTQIFIDCLDAILRIQVVAIHRASVYELFVLTQSRD
jgi:hypothetical protein